MIDGEGPSTPSLSIYGGIEMKGKRGDEKGAKETAARKRRTVLERE